MGAYSIYAKTFTVIDPSAASITFTIYEEPSLVGGCVKILKAPDAINAIFKFTAYGSNIYRGKDPVLGLSDLMYS